jgi:hypothetical protein
MPLLDKPHVGHENHLCELHKRGVSLDEFRQLVIDPQFGCKQCGRVAKSSDSLCDPFPL